MAGKKISQFNPGVTEMQHFQLPTPASSILSTPTSRGIFQNLSKIGYNNFPEFVEDILIHCENHRRVDITDGTGDEKQDILTINSTGERCLTQCKHSINIESHYAGDELDRMVVALLRKNCKQGIFVTNSDLTPQAKAYVNDDEYKRFWKGEDGPTVEYWNGVTIWNKIKDKPVILNKWFGGQGQTTGLRNFTFEIAIRHMPFEPGFPQKTFEVFINVLKNCGFAEEIRENVFQRTSETYTAYIKPCIQDTRSLDIPFLLPYNETKDFINNPHIALRVEFQINRQGAYDVDQIRDEFVNELGSFLPAKDITSWWHITTSQIHSFILLHDLNLIEPRQIDLCSAKTYVQTENRKIIPEIDYCDLFLPRFKIMNSEDNEEIWIDTESGIQIIQNFAQLIDPIWEFNQQVAHLRRVELYEKYRFHAAERVDSNMSMRVRRLLDNEWISMIHNGKNFIWGIPPQTNEEQINFVHKKIEQLGLKVLNVNHKFKKEILSETKLNFDTPIEYYNPSISELVFPVALPKRIFLLSKELPVKQKITIESSVELLKFKAGIENEFGYDMLHGKDAEKINSSEIPHLLFDLFTIRGTRMLDIGTSTNPAWFTMRFAEVSLESSDTLARNYINQFIEAYNEAYLIINGQD